jgi:hypothetical protein
MITEEELLTREKNWQDGYWEIPDDIDTTKFDFNWRPYKFDRPYIHQFGTQHQKTGGPKFIVPNFEGVKYQDCQHAIKLPKENNRCWRPLINNATIDFSWHPDETDPPYIYVFGNQWHDVYVMPSFQYRVPGATDKKYITDFKATLLPVKSNWEIPEHIDDSNFDYSWVPDPHEHPLTWEFGTQWQINGGPKYIALKSDQIKYCDQQQVRKLPNIRDWRNVENIKEFDYSWHPDNREPPFMYQFGTQWQKTGGPIYVVSGSTQTKYCADTKAIKLPQEHNWRIIEPIESFDYSWHPDETDGAYNYIFGNQYHCSEHMPTLMYKMKGAQENKYINDIKPKLKIDCVNYTDSVFDAMADHKDQTRYISISNVELNYNKLIEDDPIPHVHIIDNVAAIVPKGTKIQVYDKLHDYPYIKYHKLGYTNKPLDIIFLSNGEEGAEENYEHLLSLVKGLPNNIIGLKNIKGRVASQHEAANMASTPWYFLINGKCKVNPEFDFSWQPDRMCTARHYIFRATNPVNGLEYGHMAIVANNKRLTLNTTGKGLDFTLDSPHAIVNVNSGIGIFNTSEWDTWRTAFREVIKLKHNVEMFNDKASKERLHIWTTVAHGDFSDWALRGANDAVQYYDSVNGDFDSLKLSYDWAWLQNFFNSSRS